MRKLPKNARTWVATMWALGALTLAAAAVLLPWMPRPEGEAWEFALFVLLGALAGRTKVRLVRHKGGDDTGSMSLGFAFIFATLLRFGPHAAMVVGAVSTFCSCLLPKRQRAHQFGFNMALNAFETFAAGMVFVAANGGSLELNVARSFPAVMAATLTFFVIDTGAVATVIALCTGRDIRPLWKEMFLWTAPSFFAAAGVSTVALMILSDYAGTVLLFLSPVAYLTYQSYSLYTARAEERQRRLEEKQTHIEALQVSEAQLASALQRERQIADALQRSFLLTTPEGTYPDLSVETRYLAASDETLIGGDFYDTFAIDNDKVALVVGDASGKGLAAAVRIAEVKYALRAYAREGAGPAATLARLNAFECDFQRRDNRPLGTFTAVSFAVVDTRTGEVTIASAGTEPALFLSRNGAATVVDASGMPLGVEEAETYPETVIRLAPGDLLLLLTDGITESRDSKYFLGYDGFVGIARESLALPTLADMAQGILSGAQRFAGGTLHDDACLLVARWQPVGAAAVGELAAAPGFPQTRAATAAAAA
jgi:serine phosphatase RsbU (regulator of sigma subunit)